ncbi:rCG45426 [Rattus norvegicus]|uniref:RCG45426 n=1 Tax=Rattus norvegicus TaxID=10116 RepID=A6K361_RAT|nr:rCG54717 [Rattus norvegicus]EDL85639.1 rCG51772 [Rattus norvegicus]EDL93673.1 rCG45426 [Rattus norvegicus]
MAIRRQLFDRSLPPSPATHERCGLKSP